MAWTLAGWMVSCSVTTMLAMSGWVVGTHHRFSARNLISLELSQTHLAGRGRLLVHGDVCQKPIVADAMKASFDVPFKGPLWTVPMA